MEKIDYKGYEIKINVDDCPINPWEDWDCGIPLIASHERNYVVAYGGLDIDYLPELTGEEIKSNLDDIKYLLGDKSDSLIKILKQSLYAYYDADTAVDAVNYMLEEEYQDLNYTGKLSFLSDIYTIKGIANLNASIHGFSQGDYADVLVVATPNFLKEIGAPRYSITSMKEDIKLYEDYCYGNCYWFDIPSISSSHNELYASSGGFYGCDHEQSGLLESARDYIDYYIEVERKKKIAQVKKWIKNKVPLSYRVFS